MVENDYLLLLDRQLQGVHSSILVCKWPVILATSFFVTLLCWEMAGDREGWLEALWVPAAGLVMVFLIWLWDRALVSQSLDLRSFLDTLVLDCQRQKSLPDSIELQVSRSALHLTSRTDLQC